MIADACAEATVPVRELERAADFHGNVLGLRPGVSLLPRTDVVYDLPELKTVDEVATVGGHRFAWFRTPTTTFSAFGTDRP
jgi:hypothetical protein